MRPGFLGETEYWFSGSGYGDIYQPQTSLPWYEHFYVAEPFYNKYLDQADWARQVRRTTGNE